MKVHARQRLWFLPPYFPDLNPIEQAFAYLLSSSKKGVSSNQLHRTLGCTLKTAWFISHRVREAIREGGPTPMGGAGGIVGVDETYFGKLPRALAHAVAFPPQPRAANQNRLTSALSCRSWNAAATQRLLYRLAMGQPDQEDLVDLLASHDWRVRKSCESWRWTYPPSRVATGLN